MSGFTLTTTVSIPFEDAVAQVREQLASIGFGVLTEIDIKKTFKNKLDADVPPQIILGACQPELAYEALQADPRVAAIMPCNVVVRDVGGGATTIEALDPNVMPELTGTIELQSVVAQARDRLADMLRHFGA